MKTQLTPEQLATYHRDGFLILRQWFSPAEVEAMQTEAAALYTSDFVDPDNLRTPVRKRADGGTEVERIDPVIDISPRFRHLIEDQRITGPLRQIFGEPACLFKDKLIFKHPGISGYTMHQDFAWWQPQGPESPLPTLRAEQILSVMVGIDAADELNGAVELFPGYHDRLLTPKGVLCQMGEEEVAQIDLTKGVLGKTAPGDVVIFHSLTPHRSASNRSSGSRRQLYLSYNAQSAGDVYAAQQAHYQAYSLRSRKANGAPNAYFR